MDHFFSPLLLSFLSLFPSLSSSVSDKSARPISDLGEEISKVYSRRRAVNDIETRGKREDRWLIDGTKDKEKRGGQMDRDALLFIYLFIFFPEAQLDRSYNDRNNRRENE